MRFKMNFEPENINIVEMANMKNKPIAVKMLEAYYQNNGTCSECYNVPKTVDTDCMFCQYLLVNEAIKQAKI